MQKASGEATTGMGLGMGPGIGRCRGIRGLPCPPPRPAVGNSLAISSRFTIGAVLLSGRLNGRHGLSHEQGA
jgi:hypothetical protein